jgi:hypothetical protein
LSPHPSYVVDTNTLIDLHFCNLLPRIFTLPCTFIITDFLRHEIRFPPFDELSRMGLIVEPLTSAEVAEISELLEIYDKPSYEDISVLILAKSQNTILISGDENLRHVAVQIGVTCYGTCWLLDFLASQSIIAYKDAISAYQVMQQNRRNPPKNECKNLLSEWRKKSKMLD